MASDPEKYHPVHGNPLDKDTLKQELACPGAVLCPDQGVENLEALDIVSSGPPYSAFSTQQRRCIIFMVACASFFSPLSANIYFPALTSLSRDLHVSNGLINVSLTTYMIFQGLAPTVFGDLGDMAGRRPALILGFVIYIGANIGLALQNKYSALIILRCLQSTGSSGTVALGNGVVADISSSGERGKFMGMARLLNGEREYTEECPRYCPIRAYGCSCVRTHTWRHPDPVPWLAMAFLVFDHLGGCLHDSSCHCFSRDRPKLCRQWVRSATAMEHVLPQLPASAQNQAK